MAIVLLAKSKETFKLSELQYTEAKIQAAYLPHNNNKFPSFNVTRLLVDRSTGSSLFLLECNQADTSLIYPASSWLQRCDWVGQVMEQGYDAQDLINMLTCAQPKFSATRWTLDYVRMVDTTIKDVKSYSKKGELYNMKTLLCSVAHAMPSYPALNPELAEDKFLIVDTMTNSNQQTSSCYVIRYIKTTPPVNNKDDRSSKENSFANKWAKRPFQYSSAINPSIAEMVIEILDTLCRHQHRENKMNDGHRILLDPTCGSGTFLAFGIQKGFHVKGYDQNANAVTGALHNLEHMFPKELVEQYASVKVRDSSTSFRNDETSILPNSCLCCCANLPWGQNSVEYIEENERILRSLRGRIPTGTPCAFITRASKIDSTSSSSSLFDKTGFEVIEQAYVPQRDFLLPSSTKKSKKKRDDALDHQSTTGRCVITIALATS